MLSAAFAGTAAPAAAEAVVHETNAVVVGRQYIAWKATIPAGDVDFHINQVGSGSYAHQKWIMDEDGNHWGTGAGTDDGVTVAYGPVAVSGVDVHNTWNPLFPSAIPAGEYTFIAIVDSGPNQVATVSLNLPAGSTVHNSTTGPAFGFNERDFDASQPEVTSPLTDVRSVHGSVSVTASNQLFGFLNLGYDGGTATITYPDSTVVDVEIGDFVRAGAGTTTVSVDIEGAGIGSAAPSYFYFGGADVVLP